MSTEPSLNSILKQEDNLGGSEQSHDHEFADMSSNEALLGEHLTNNRYEFYLDEDSQADVENFDTRLDGSATFDQYGLDYDFWDL